MIDVVTDVVTSTFAFIEFFLLTGSRTGELIVYTCLRAASMIKGFFDVLTTVAVIIVEDNTSFFVQDIPGIVDDIAGALLYYNPITAIEYLVNLILSSFTILCNTLHACLYFINGVIYNIFRTLKTIISLLGAAVWFLITFIPYNLTEFVNFVLYSIYDVAFNVVQYLCNIVIEAYGLLLEVANSMTDVPLQSFLGIIIGTFIFKVINRYKGDICIFFREIYAYMITASPREEPNIDILNVDEVEARAGAWQETSCVVCRDSEKCVVTFPCKHICMCRRCFRHVFVSDQLQRRCPICRTFINDFLLVYI